MKVWFKRSLLGLVVIFIVALVGAAIFLLTFDPNAYKRKLEEIVYERYQRTLAIEGEIELSLFPRIGLSVNGVSLSERNSDQTFMSVDSARFAVAIWPLMSNQFVVDHVSLNGFKVWLEREKDGSFNFSDLLDDTALESLPATAAHSGGWIMGAAQAAEVANPAEVSVSTEPEPVVAKEDEPGSELSKVLASLKEAVSPDTGKTKFQIDIAGLDFREGEVHYYDHILGGGGQIVGLDMNTGRMTFGQPFDLKFKGRLQGTKPHMEAALDGQALLRLDPYSHIYAAQRINVQVQGDVGSYKTEQLQLKGGVEYQSLVGVVRVQGMELTTQGELASRTMPLSNVQASLAVPELIYAGQHSLLRIQRMALRTKGNYEHDTVELALDIPDVYMDSNSAEMKSPVVGSLIRSGVDSTGIKLRIEELSGTEHEVRAQRFSVDTVLKQPLQAWVLKVVSPLVWQRAQKTLTWEALTGVFSLEDEGLPNQRVQADVTGSLAWATPNNQWDTHLEIGESAGRITADARYQPNATPNVEFTAQVQDTDFANWIPSAEVRKQRGRVVSGEQQDATEKFVGPVAGTVMDLRFLESYTVQGKAQLQNVKVGKFTLEQLKADLGVSQGELLLKLNSAEFYQGSLLSELRLKSDGSLRASVDAYGVESGAILEDAFGQTRMSGKSDVSARVTAAGHTPAAWLRSLSGTFNMDTVDGRVYGLDAFETLASVVDVAKNAFSPQLPSLALGFDLGRSTSFSALSLQSTLRDGVLSFSSMLANSPDLRISMRKPSSINLVDQTLDLTLEFRLQSQMRGNAHASLLKELFKVTVPVQLTGALSRPDHRILWNEISSKLVQQALDSGLVEKLVSQPLLDSLMDARETGAALTKKVEQAAPSRSLGVLFRDLVGGAKF